MGKKSKKTSPITKLTTLLLVFIFSFCLNFDKVEAYAPLDVQSDSLKSVFDKNPFQFSPIDLSKFVPNDRSGLTFTDLANTKSFSTKDIGTSIKAVLILFLKLMVTTLNVTLGILKALLGVLNQTDGLKGS